MRLKEDIFCLYLIIDFINTLETYILRITLLQLHIQFGLRKWSPYWLYGIHLY